MGSGAASRVRTRWRRRRWRGGRSWWGTVITVRATWFFGRGPAALIDFGPARPATGAYELASAAFWWVPLWDPVDRPEGFAGLDAGARLRALVDAYGADRALRERVVEEGVLERSARAQPWLQAQAPRLREVLVQGAG